MGHFDLKSWVTGGSKIRSKIPNNWRIFESNWLDIESQFDSNIFKLLGILDRILDPPGTQLFRSKWLNFSFSLVFLEINNGTKNLITNKYAIIMHALSVSKHDAN